MYFAYENLGSERFQKLAQAVLAVAYPGTQFFPTGQPDGGRDAILQSKSSNDFEVFQIKIVKRQPERTDLDEWVEDIVSLEQPKFERLTADGATRFNLVTNLQGTAHFKAGSIDRVTEKIKAAFGENARVLYSTDLDTYLRANDGIILSFPEILNGLDGLRWILKRVSTEHAERRALVLKAFVAAQYEDEKQLKFRQIDFYKDLLKVYVDIPFLFQVSDQHTVQKYAQLATCIDIHNQEVPEGGAPLIHGPAYNRLEGVALFVMSTASKGLWDQLVIEGGPGQGKSTLTQYICQLNRVRWLNDEADRALIPDEYFSRASHFPIRLELRNYGLWINGEDPFVPANSPQRNNVPDISLESFICRMVQRLSGGGSFDVADLLATVEATTVLLVLDGFDEVAEIATRHDVVAQVRDTVARLKRLNSNTTVLITSRPAAFSNSPGFPQAEFPVLRLRNLQNQHIDKYASNFQQANNMPDAEVAEFQTQLAEKRQQSIIADLLKNPMQLTIFLVLLRNNGPGLPNKRTALFSEYTRLFFDREAGKNAIVKKWRNLILEIHQYIAWHLHSTAESAKADGRISADELQLKLFEYLSSCQQDTSLIEPLFGAMLERVVMLVSRAEGTYEFEVQPLREYFAAGYLHDTAPSGSHVGVEGISRHDRFSGILRNFYWSNVARFFAGSFNRGELRELGDRVTDFIDSPEYRLLKYPVRVSCMFLRDLSFEGSPRAQAQIADAILDGSNIWRMLPSTNYGESWHDFHALVPEGYAAEELKKKFIALMMSGLKTDRLNAVANTIFLHGGGKEALASIAELLLQEDDAKRKKYLLEAAMTLASLDLSLCDKLRILVDHFDPTERADAAAQLVLGNFIEGRDIVEMREKLVGAWIGGSLYPKFEVYGDGIIEGLVRVLRFVDGAHAFADNEEFGTPVGDLIGEYFGEINDSFEDPGICELYNWLSEELRKPLRDWLGGTGVAKRVIERMTRLYGVSVPGIVEWVDIVMASDVELVVEPSEAGVILKKAESIVMKAKENFAATFEGVEALSSEEQIALLAFAIHYAPNDQVAPVLETVCGLADSVSAKFGDCLFHFRIHRRGRDAAVDWVSLPTAQLINLDAIRLSNRVTLRCVQHDEALLDVVLEKVNAGQLEYVNVAARILSMAIRKTGLSDVDILGAVALLYGHGGIIEVPRHNSEMPIDALLPEKMAQLVLANEAIYPLALVDLAEAIEFKRVAAGVERIRDVARDGAWFGHLDRN